MFTILFITPIIYDLSAIQISDLGPSLAVLHHGILIGIFQVIVN